MYVDRTLAAGHRFRTAGDHGADILLDAWVDAPADRRASMIAAHGDLARAAAYAGGGWEEILNGDVSAALQRARAAAQAPGMAFLEAEALFSAGAVVASLGRLEKLHEQGEPAATLALVRRRHQFGDHVGAMRAARALPWHAGTALTGARAALTAGRPEIALQFVEPFVQGFAPLPEPATAGSAAVTVAATLAKLGQHKQLRRFADRLVAAADLPEDMMPTAARTAWIAGRQREAWERFGIVKNPWCIAARLELAILAGNAELAARLLREAGPLGTLSAPAVRLLKGGPPRQERDSGRADEVFAEGRTVHVWRTHPHRWKPWIDAVLRTPADVVVCDLAAGELPDPETVPAAVMDDGALVDALAPVTVPPSPAAGSGVRVSDVLCRGIGVGHDWPEEEMRLLYREVQPAARHEALAVVGADEALALAGRGNRLIVVAPPGDPFWAGPLPEAVWPSLRIVRADPRTGWRGAGRRIAEAVRALLAPRDSTAPPGGESGVVGEVR